MYMCVDIVVGFKIGALTFLSHHEHHRGGPHGAVAGYPAVGSPLFSPCWRQVLVARPTGVHHRRLGLPLSPSADGAAPATVRSR